MLRDFISIDFETANQQPSSVCSVGVVMVRDGQVVDSFYSLIRNAIQTMHQYSPKCGNNWRNVLQIKHNGAEASTYGGRRWRNDASSPAFRYF